VNSLACHVDRVDAAHFFLEHELVREAVPNTNPSSKFLTYSFTLARIC
jgi:hypothetical protein